MITWNAHNYSSLVIRLQLWKSVWLFFNYNFLNLYFKLFRLCLSVLITLCLIPQIWLFVSVYKGSWDRQKKIENEQIVFFLHIAKNWLIDKLPKLQMIKSILRQHLAGLQATLCIVNNIAICEVPTVGD